MPNVLSLIHFSGESRVVLGDDKGRASYGAGEDNPEALISSIKYLPSLVVFAIIGVGFKSDLLLVEGTINADRDIQTLCELSFMNAFDRKFRPFGWILQQDEASSHKARVIMKWSKLRKDCLCRS
jgi:hypothetical protein